MLKICDIFQSILILIPFCTIQGTVVFFHLAALLSLIVAGIIAGPAVYAALYKDQVSCEHQVDHQKQDHQHNPYNLQVLGNHHCTLVHPCKTEHLENFACFPFLIRISQFEHKKSFEPPTYRPG